MNENRLLVESAARAAKGGEKVALATVVRVAGSSYRSPGAKLLVTSAGELCGSVSGGCLERDLCNRALRAMALGASRLVRYDTRADADDERAEALVQSAGLGCEGVIEIWLETQPEAHLAAIASLLQSGEPRDFAIALPGGGTFLDRLRPAPRVTLFGAGPDAVPLVELAHGLGWDATVVDCRSAVPVPRRLFQRADRYVTAEVERAAELAGVGPESLVLLMTHNYERDRAVLAQLRDRMPRYLGILGPRARSERLIADVWEGALPASALDRIHAPVGLDLGGDSPQAVALSALAEIQAVLSGRHGGPLRDRKGPIHERTA